MPQQANGSKPLILASVSPRRSQLLGEAGYSFEVYTPPYLEPDTDHLGLTPRAHAEALSYFKAKSVAERIERGLVLGADTVVACRDTIFGKPADAADARRILEILMHAPHEVITGVTLIDAADGRRLIRHDVTRVVMRPMPAGKFEAYIASGDWEGKAGAYGIQDSGDAFIDRIDGSFSNVVGLPMELLGRMLAEFETLAPSV